MINARLREIEIYSRRLIARSAEVYRQSNVKKNVKIHCVKCQTRSRSSRLIHLSRWFLTMEKNKNVSEVVQWRVSRKWLWIILNLNFVLKYFRGIERWNFLKFEIEMTWATLMILCNFFKLRDATVLVNHFNNARKNVRCKFLTLQSFQN